MLRAVLPNSPENWIASSVGSVTGIGRGFTGGPWEGKSPGFPRYVWYKDGATVYEGRLVNREMGQYKGYPLEESEWPSGFEGIDARS